MTYKKVENKNGSAHIRHAEKINCVQKCRVNLAMQLKDTYKNVELSYKKVGITYRTVELTYINVEDITRSNRRYVQKRRTFVQKSRYNGCDR